MEDCVEMNKQVEIENKLSGIRKGAHWFRVIGGVFIFFGCLGLLVLVITSTLAIVDGVFLFGEVFKSALDITFTIIFGWCFMMVSDCMKAIDYLFKESQDVV